MVAEPNRRPTAAQLYESGSGGPTLYVDAIPFRAAVEAVLVASRSMTDRVGLRAWTPTDPETAQRLVLAALKELTGANVSRRPTGD